MPTGHEYTASGAFKFQTISWRALLWCAFLWVGGVSSAAEALVSSSSTAVDQSNPTMPFQPQQKIHLIVLVHGWMGSPNELGYLQESLERQTRERFAKEEKTTTTTTTSAPRHIVRVHTARCNDGRTMDGIAAGGKRLADEVNQLLQPLLEPQQQQQASSSSVVTTQVSLSIVGNSLGGLYARYALPYITSLQECRAKQPTPEETSGDNGPSDTATTTTAEGGGEITPSFRAAVFCTTATPHLGVSQQTFLRIPSAVEFVVGNVMRTTGRDLFRLTSVVDDLTRQAPMLDSLRVFERRIAHANSHQTDFQVPTATAAFVDPDSSSLHTTTRSTRILPDAQPYWRLQVSTAPVASTFRSDSSSSRPATSRELAEQLDSLGWTKVFWDVRATLPTLSSLLPWSSTSSGTKTSTSQPTAAQYTSRQLHQEFAGFHPNDNQVYLPFGHTMLVANAKNDLYARLNAAGRPIMDQVAHDLLDYILQ